MACFKHAKSSKFNCALMLALINTKLSSGETNFGKSKVSLVVDKNPTDIIDENIVKNMNNLNLLLNNNRKLILESEISPLLSENRLKNYKFHLIDNDKSKSECNVNPLYRQCNGINKEIDGKNDEKHYQEIEEPLMINTEASSTTDHCEMPIMDIIVAPLSGKETLHEEKSLLTETERPLINENLNHYNLNTFPLVALFRHEQSIKDTSKRNASLADERLSNHQKMLPPNEVKLELTHEDRMSQMKKEKLRKTVENNLIIEDEINVLKNSMLPEDKIISEQTQTFDKLQTPKVKISDDKEPKIEGKYPQIDDEINHFIGPKMLPQKEKEKLESVQTEIKSLTTKVKRKYPQIDDEIINGLIGPKMPPEEYRIKSEHMQINDKLQTAKVKRRDDKEPKIERKYPQIDDEINSLIGPKLLPEEYRIKSKQIQIIDKLQTANVKRSNDKEPKIETKYPQIDDEINVFIGPKMVAQNKVTLKPVQTEVITLQTAKIKRSGNIEFVIERKYVPIEDDSYIPTEPNTLPKYKEKLVETGDNTLLTTKKIYYKMPEIEMKYIPIDGKDLFNGTNNSKNAKILANKEQTELIVADMPKIEKGKAKIIEVFKTGVNDGLTKNGKVPRDAQISPKSVLLRKRATDQSQTDSEIAILDVFLNDEDDREMSQDDDTLASIRKEYFLAKSRDHILGSELENGRTIPIIRAKKSSVAILKNDSNNEKKMFFKDFKTMSFMSAAADQAEPNFNTSAPQNYSKLTSSILNQVYLRSEINNPYRIGINDLELLQNRRETPDFYNDNDFYTLPFDEIGTPLQEIERRLGSEREWHLTQDDFRSIKRQLGRSNEIKGNMEFAVNDSVEAIQSKIDEVKTIVRDFYRINAAINENMCNPIPYLILLTVVVIINAV